MCKVEDLIIKSFKELKTIGSESGQLVGAQKIISDSRLIFPQYREKDNADSTKANSTRVSEQEARFLFVKQLETDKDHHYYSVEAPTKKKYKFSDKDGNKDEDKFPCIDDKGRSASIDVCLYNKNGSGFERLHLIEFKFDNQDQKDFSKDFLKLLCDEDKLTNYFVHIVAVEDLLNDSTLCSITGKYKEAIKHAWSDRKDSTLIIFLYNIGENRYFESNVIDTSNTLNFTEKSL
jgi:hypothetical protein